jgi:sugar O-acyltransferase (sialic acid O-acetyltransferase NeuD family)
MKNKKLFIYGTGTIAEIAHFYFCTDSDYEIEAFLNENVSGSHGNTFLGKKVLSLSELDNSYEKEEIHVFVAVGYKSTNTIREQRFNELKSNGYKFASYVSSNATVLTDKIGINNFILENNVLQPFTEIGDNVYMWSGNHLGHHSIIEDNVFISSHVVISGKCVIKRNSFLGVNSCLHDGITIGEKSLIGAGSIVSKSCDPRTVYSPPKPTSRIIDRDLI